MCRLWRWRGRWEGQLIRRYSESYTFYAGPDDGVRLWINVQLVVDAWYDHNMMDSTGTISLQAGQSYSIRMDYYENGGGAAAILSWSSASQAREVVPQSQLFLPTNSGEYRSAGTNQYTQVNGSPLATTAGST